MDVGDPALEQHRPGRDRGREPDARLLLAALLALPLPALAQTAQTTATETALPENVAGKPAQVRLEGEKLIIEPLA